MKSTYLTELDEYFCGQYSDYVKLSALEGYVMPEVVYVGADGNVSRRDSEVMRLAHQKNRDELLQKLKDNLFDTDFTFNFAFRPFREKLRDRSRKYTFAKVLPSCLSRCHETVESAGEKLNIESDIWQKIVKGKVYPEKNTVIALALVCHMGMQEVTALFNVCGFQFDATSVRDVVCEYLIKQKIHNEQMQDECLAEYKITNLPIKRKNSENA